MKRFVQVSIVLLSFGAIPAIAQDFSIMANWAQQQMLNDNLQRNLANAGNAAPQARGKPPVYAVGPGIRTPHPTVGQAVAIPNAAATSYRSSPAVTTRVREQFIDFIRKTSGDQAAAILIAEFQRKDYLRLWAQQAAQDGLRMGDVADASTSYWVENWQMANKVDYAPSARVRAVRQQVSTTLLSNPAFLRMTDAQKQEMAEIFIYNQIVQGANYVGAMKRGDMALVQRLADASVIRFRNEMHLDLRKLALTDRGFVIHG